MIEHEILSVVGRDSVIGIFGDQNYPNLLSGKSVKERREVMSKFKKLVMILRPKLVYIMPTKGINRSLLPILKTLNIKYVIVNPYRGYFNTDDKKDKIPLLIGLENSKSVITISGPPSKKYGEGEILEETRDFIIDRSNIILSIFGEKPSSDIKKLNKNLEGLDIGVIFLDYSIPSKF